MKQSICRSDRRVYDASADTLLKVIRETSDDVQSLMMVGHNPGISNLVTEICAVGKTSSTARREKELPTAGLVVIDLNAKGWRDVEAKCGKLIKLVTPDSAQSRR